jgi:hypothetical protein
VRELAASRQLRLLRERDASEQDNVPQRTDHVAPIEGSLDAREVSVIGSHADDSVIAQLLTQVQDGRVDVQREDSVSCARELANGGLPDTPRGPGDQNHRVAAIHASDLRSLSWP